MMGKIKTWLLGFALLGCSAPTASPACLNACDTSLIRTEGANHSACAHCVEGRDSTLCPAGTDTSMDLATCETISDQSCQPAYNSCVEACQ